MIGDILVFLISISFIGYIIYERINQRKIRKSFKHVIHVNGTRGKSTTTRLIDAGLRECGYRVFAKTTGTIPTYINTNNEQIRVKRRGLANIREQLRTMRKASKENAEILVIECMAVSPELQYISQDKMLEADIAVITNVRSDHLLEMGYTLPEIAESLSNTMPKAKHLVLGDSEFLPIFLEKAKKTNTLVQVAADYKVDETLGTFYENINTALEVAKLMDLNLETFWQGMKKYYPDPAAFQSYKCHNTIFLNGLSINDPDSIKVVYQSLLKKYQKEDITILLNSRFDRPTRIIQHIDMLKQMDSHKVILTGTNVMFIKKRLAQFKGQVQTLNKIEDLQDEKIIFAIGNIADKGMEILQYFKLNGDVLCD